MSGMQMGFRRNRFAQGSTQSGQHKKRTMLRTFGENTHVTKEGRLLLEGVLILWKGCWTRVDM